MVGELRVGAVESGEGVRMWALTVLRARSVGSPRRLVRRPRPAAAVSSWMSASCSVRRASAREVSPYCETSSCSARSVSRACRRPATDAARLATSTLASPAVTVVHHSDDEYYELLVDGQQAGLLVYHVVGSHLSITHTVIEQTYRGRGLSWVLVGRALDDIRTRSVTVSNYCPVVNRFVEKNPEYRDLLSLPRRA